MLKHEFLIIILLQLFNFNLYVQRTVVVPIFHPELICHFCVCAFRTLSFLHPCWPHTPACSRFFSLALRNLSINNKKKKEQRNFLVWNNLCQKDFPRPLRANEWFQWKISLLAECVCARMSTDHANPINEMFGGACVCVCECGVWFFNGGDELWKTLNWFSARVSVITSVGFVGI